MADLAFSDRDNFVRNMVTVRCGCAGWAPALPIQRISTEEGLPVPIEEIAEQLRIDVPDDEMATLLAMARAAGDFIERRTGYVILRGSYQITLPGWWTGPLEIMRSPLADTPVVEGMTARNVWTPIAETDLWWDSGPRSFIVQTLSGAALPDLWSEIGRARMTFMAGFDPSDVSGSDAVLPIPPGLRQAFVMLVGHFYQNRELFAADKVAEVEAGAGSMLAAWRQFW